MSVIVTLPFYFRLKLTLTGGSLKTVEFARKHGKPCLHFHPGVEDPVGELKAFLQEKSVMVLNVAGPRASKEPGVGEFVMRTLGEAFADMAPGE